MSNLPASDGDEDFADLVGASLRFACAMSKVVDVDPGYSTGWRVMPTAVVARLLAGHALLEIEDQPTRTMRTGMATCVPSGVLHRFTHPVAGRSAFVHADFRVFHAVDALALAAVPPLMKGRAAERLGELLVELASVDVRRGPLHTACARQAIGLNLLRELLDQGRATPRAVAALRAAQRLAPVLAAVDRDPRGLDLAAMARRVELSPSRLNAVFLQAFACSPGRYLRRRRLELARALLAGTDLAVAAVGERAGFEDPFHFSRAFKQAHGLSPSDYRAQMATMQL